MAPKHIFSAVSLLFLSASCYFSRPVHARQSDFFRKTAEYAPAPAPTPVPTLVENGYGLYGSESDYSNTVIPQKELTNNNYQNEVTLSESSNNNNIDEEMLSEDESSQPNKDFYNNNDNGYYRTSVTNSDNERQGMSDTRYMESGKYYYDIKTDDALTNYHNNNGYSSSSSSTTTDDETIDPEVYGSSNEFNTMEEYYRSHSYQNTKEQEEYVP